MTPLQTARGGLIVSMIPGIFSTFKFPEPIWEFPRLLHWVKVTGGSKVDASIVTFMLQSDGFVSGSMRPSETWYNKSSVKLKLLIIEDIPNSSNAEFVGANNVRTDCWSRAPRRPVEFNAPQRVVRSGFRLSLQTESAVSMT